MTTSTYLSCLLEDNQYIELRHQTDSSWRSYSCETVDELYRKRRELGAVGNLYTSIQHLPSKPSGPIKNSDVDRYSRIFFDLDPARPPGTSSTDSELISARFRARMLRDYLRAHDWPVPAVGISGNGVHLYYRCALRVCEELLDEMRTLYDGLARRMSDDRVTFDRAVANPGRISVLFGSHKRKGQASAARPHRRSWVVVPRYWRQVSARCLSRLCNLFARADEASFRPKVIRRVRLSDGHKGDFNTLDSLGWFAGHGHVPVRVKPDIYGVKCPWHQEHTSTSPKNRSDSVIIKRADRWDIYMCAHAHCHGRRLIDVINLWGDADAYCARPYEPRDPRRQSTSIPSSADPF